MTFGDIIADCFRYLNINDIEQIKRMKICEYRALLRGYHKRYVDEMERLHLLAWQSNLAGQFKNNGSPVFPTFDKFFNRADWTGENEVQRNPEAMERWNESIKNAEDILNARLGGSSFEGQ